MRVVTWNINSVNARLDRLTAWLEAHQPDHVLLAGGTREDGHGTDPKLRTVLWAWLGEPIEADELADLRRLEKEWEAGVGPQLGELLSPDEVAMTRRRLRRLLRRKVFPAPSPDWPAIPWPWY